MEMDGTATKTDTGYRLTFERDLPHPPEKVWEAFTDAERISEWLGGPNSVVELKVGGRVHFPAHTVESEIRELDPPRVIAFGWDSPEWGPGGTVRWELTPTGTGTRLVMTHDAPEPSKEVEDKVQKKMGWGDEMRDTIPRTLAGWHTIIDQLDSVLAGNGPLSNEDDHWRPLFELYRKDVDAPIP
jgi:uncharacterized protein YndB with AHSA1/START domain